MDFKAILDGIEAEGQQQIRKIENEAAGMLDEINRAAEKAASERRERIMLDGRARLNRERAIIGQQASVQALQVHADARQKLIARVLGKVNGAFDTIRKRKDYEDFLSITVEEVISSLMPSLIEGQKIVIHMDALDKKAGEKIISTIEEPVVIQYDIETSGGCNGESEDGQVSTLNTIESRFIHADQIIQQELSVFFEEKISSD